MRLTVLASTGRGLGLVLPAWVWWQVVVVELGDLWAAKGAEDRSKLLVEEIEGRGREGAGREHIWQTHLDVLVDEASEVVALE